MGGDPTVSVTASIADLGSILTIAWADAAGVITTIFVVEGPRFLSRITGPKSIGFSGVVYVT